MPLSLRDRGGTLNNVIPLHSCGDFDSDTCNCTGIERVESFNYLVFILTAKLPGQPTLNT